MRSTKLALLLSPLLAAPSWAASLPTPSIACDTGSASNTTCDRSTDGSTTINKPTHVVAGDTLVGICYTDGSAINSLTGFTEVGTETVIPGTSFREAVFYKTPIGDGEAATYTLGVTGGSVHGCYLSSYKHVAQSGAYESNMTTTSGSGDTTGELSNISTSADNALVWYACAADSTQTCTPPAGFTEEHDAGNGLCSGWKIQASAGAIGSNTVTFSATAGWVCDVGSFAPNGTGTRIYLPSTGAPAVSPAFGSVWEDADQSDRIAAVFTRGSTAMTTHTSNEETADTTAKDHLSRQYVIQVGAQTISGVVQCNARWAESNGATNAFTTTYIELADSSGSRTGEILLNTTGTTGTPEMGTVLAARNVPSRGDVHTMTSQTAANDDYLVMEMGSYNNNTSNIARTVTSRWGDTAATPLDRDDAETTDNHPWCDFLGGLAAPGGGPACTAGLNLTLLGVGGCP